MAVPFPLLLVSIYLIEYELLKAETLNYVNRYHGLKGPVKREGYTYLLAL